MLICKYEVLLVAIRRKKGEVEVDLDWWVGEGLSEVLFTFSNGAGSLRFGRVEVDIASRKSQDVFWRRVLVLLASDVASSSVSRLLLGFAYCAYMLCLILLFVSKSYRMAQAWLE